MEVWPCFSEIWEYDFLKLVGLNNRKNQYQKKEHDQNSSVFKALR